MACKKETHYILMQRHKTETELEMEKETCLKEGKKVIVIREGKQPAQAGLRAVIAHHVKAAESGLEQKIGEQRGER